MGQQTAWLDPRCSARVVARRSLRYEAGADAALDRPAFVRAASGLAWVGERLGVVQDDANFVALVEPASGLALDVPLPPDSNGHRLFDVTRGTKQRKLDLEACLCVREGDRLRFIALGSGSTHARERIVVLEFRGRRVSELRVLDASALYQQLRACSEFSGSELNLEGAALRGDTLLLFQRGNGEKRGDRRPVNAVGTLEWPRFRDFLEGGAVPSLGSVTHYDLGALDEVAFTFTDAARAPSDRVVFLASAEDSSGSTTDGVVLGARVGELQPDGSARMAVLVDERGAPSRDKAEGIALDPHDPHRAWLVVDMDDPALASELLEVELAFPP